MANFVKIVSNELNYGEVEHESSIKLANEIDFMELVSIVVNTFVERMEPVVDISSEQQIVTKPVIMVKLQLGNDIN